MEKMMPKMENDIPQIRQSNYSGIAPVTNYDSYGDIQQTNLHTTNQTPTLTDSAPINAASNADIKVKNTNSEWVNKKWRPMMGWTYMATCLFDFIIAPILWSIIQAVDNSGLVTSQWQPLTLQGAGLYHIAMGAVLGITAFGRTQEKKAGVENGSAAKY